MDFASLLVKALAARFASSAQSIGACCWTETMTGGDKGVTGGRAVLTGNTWTFLLDVWRSAGSTGRVFDGKISSGEYNC